MGSIHLFKMRSGEEVLAQIEEFSECGWYVSHPRRVIMTEKYGNAGTYTTEPYIVSVIYTDMFIPVEHVMTNFFEVDIKDEFIRLYNHGIGIYNDPLA
jgi:hypothetical protein